VRSGVGFWRHRAAAGRAARQRRPPRHRAEAPYAEKRSTSTIGAVHVQPNRLPLDSMRPSSLCLEQLHPGAAAVPRAPLLVEKLRPVGRQGTVSLKASLDSQEGAWKGDREREGGTCDSDTGALMEAMGEGQIGRAAQSCPTVHSD
jgi:hypothetical protein